MPRDVKLMAAYFLAYPAVVWLATNHGEWVWPEHEPWRFIAMAMAAMGAPIWCLIGIPLYDATSDPEKAKHYRLSDKH